MEYLPRYTAEQLRRHEVTPGLTGWAQVHGRQLLDFDARFELDRWYVDHWSLRLDMKILVLTARMVLTGDGTPPADYVYSGVRTPTVPMPGSTDENPTDTDRQRIAEWSSREGETPG
jgi:hypothetical protein